MPEIPVSATRTSSGHLRAHLALGASLFLLYPVVQVEKGKAQHLQRTPSVREIARKAMRAIVYVRTTDEAGHTVATGSGFYERSVAIIANRRERLDRIVTNQHVVAGASHIYVSSVSSSVEREVSVCRLDDLTDLALLVVRCLSRVHSLLLV